MELQPAVRKATRLTVFAPQVRSALSVCIISFWVLSAQMQCVVADRKSFDCPMRQLAMDYAKKIQPGISRAHLQQLADALNGAEEAQNCSVSPDKEDSPSLPDDQQSTMNSSVHGIPPGSKQIYVDAVKGDDMNPGTKDKPVQTIQRAVELARGSHGVHGVILLRGGTFYLSETILLGPEDGELTFQSYNGEEVWISGAKRVYPQWKPHNTTGANIYVADLSSDGFDEVLGLRVNGKRAIRARYPNGDPELGFGSQLQANSWLPPTKKPAPDTEIHPAKPLRDTANMFQHYQLGVGGSCEQFHPPAGYWCGNGTEGGGAFTYLIPSGVVANRTVLPNSPYKDASTAVIQAWRPGHWASWMFAVGDYTADTGTFRFAKGGFQGARGSAAGEDFYIENVLEELDSANEWFFDARSQKLYLWYNASGIPAESTVFELPRLKVLFNATGSQSDPVVNVQFQGVNFRDAAYTYLDAHGMPSGGDWALQRTAALFFEGTEGTVIDSCVFSRLDGNAVMMSGFNRGALVENSEFAWIGDTAIAQWGYTSGTSIHGYGPDGTDGNQPRGTRIVGNFAHELGIWEKQSSFYFQAKSCQSVIERNIFFNGPRAGINFNDGFGGGSNISENLLLNTCRESGDHGPFNSWDRQVYVTKIANGSQTSAIKAYDTIQKNFIIANYNSQEAIDNDDGSCFYNTHQNFFAYSGNGMKNDFGGHDNHHHNNIYAYVDIGYLVSDQEPGHNDMFYNNTVVMNRDGMYGEGLCSGPAKVVVHDNQIYSPTGAVSECLVPLKRWQEKGNDPGTTAAAYPHDDVLINDIRSLLEIPARRY